MGGGTSPEASTESPEASVQGLGGDQSRGIENTERITLNLYLKLGRSVHMSICPSDKKFAVLVVLWGSGGFCSGVLGE